MTLGDGISLAAFYLGAFSFFGAIAYFASRPKPHPRPGHLCVPIEPTEAMVDAGISVMAAWHDLPGSALTVNREKMRRRYKAMLLAAPHDRL